jgi:multimeric flavodoxin WrbA
MILAVQGSPKPNSNLSKMVKRIAEGTGYKYELIDLPKLNISPCMGCVKCAKNNRCIQNDDMAPLYDKLEAADALILGGVTYFGAPNGFTRNFMERMFPLRHHEPTTMNKPSLAVAVGGNQPQITAEQISSHLQNYFNFNNVGYVYFKSDNPPCFICGYSTQCQYGGPANQWRKEEFENFTEVTEDMFKNFEQNTEAVNACDNLAATLKEVIEKGVSSHPRAGIGFNKEIF